MNNPSLILKVVRYLELDDIYNLSFTNKENFELLKPYGHIHSYIIKVYNGGSSYDYGFNEKIFENKVKYMIQFMNDLKYKYSIKSIGFNIKKKSKISKIKYSSWVNIAN